MSIRQIEKSTYVLSRNKKYKNYKRVPAYWLTKISLKNTLFKIFFFLKKIIIKILSHSYHITPRKKKKTTRFSYTSEVKPIPQSPKLNEKTSNQESEKGIVLGF